MPKEIPPSAPEGESATPFEEFSFVDMELAPLDAAVTDSEGTTWRGRQGVFKVASRGVELEGQVRSAVGEDVEKRLTKETFKIRMVRDDSEITLELSISYPSDQEGRAETSVYREDKESKLPKGIGREAYEKVLDLIQAHASKEQRRIVHRVERAPDLDPEKWHKLFDSILERRGYHPTGDKKYPWEKIYDPGEVDGADL